MRFLALDLSSLLLAFTNRTGKGQFSLQFQRKAMTKNALTTAQLQSSHTLVKGFPGGSEVKASARNAGNLGSIPGSGRSPGEGNGNPHQYWNCLENSTDGGAW